jgi:hypothetical protein
MTLLVGAPAVRAQAQENIANLPAVDDNVTNDDTHDPPSRVARISVADGSVSIQPGSTGDWGDAAKNRPVTINDRIWVDKDSRAELQAGQITIHLGSMTALSFLNLDQNVTQIRLPEGKINFRVREIRQGENYEVDTPNLAFTVKQAGAFRIDVNENGDGTSVSVIRGAGEIAASGQVYPVNAGERYDVTGTEGNVAVNSAPAAEPDDLDRWAQQRDVAEDNSASSRYVNRDVLGYGDLDDYGTWRQEPDNGNVWVPNNVPPDWAPYSNGYWTYIGPWGWTWVDYAPWGFAPFHYGRWNWYGSYWGWSPGPIWAYPYYGPAFVGFLGGFGFGFGFGLHAWFPLGWGEPFHPWYHCGVGYWRNVNAHNTFINNFHNNVAYYNHYNYAYAHNPRAVTTASHNAFVNGQTINRSSQHLTEASLRGAQVTNRINATPTHASYFGAANAHSNVARPINNVQNRSVMARTTPATAASGVRTMNAMSHTPNRPMSAHAMSNPGINSSRMAELNANRPPSASQPGHNGTSNLKAGRSMGAFNDNTNRTTGNSTRTWSAQGNTTDSGRAPQGIGRSNRPSTSTMSNHADRPPWSGSGASRSMSNTRPSTNYNGGRSYSPPSYNSNRASNPYSGGNRGYAAPRSYSASPSYAAPRSYSAAPRSNSAPHYSGGGGGYHGGGGGGSHGGGGGGGHVSGGGGHGGGGHR